MHNIPILKIIVIFLISLYSYSALSQTQKQNTDKYWKYRTRLVNDFMLGIGPEIGYSFPFMERYRRGYSKEAVLYWDDATIGLGYYIAVLATEYKLLSENNKNTNKTIRELFYALKVVNNLDYWAEAQYYKSDKEKGKPNLNGFFIREITTDSMIKNTDYSLYNKNDNLIKVTKLYGGSVDNTPNKVNAEMSKDQAIFLMVGLRLVYNLLPDSLQYFENGSVIEFRDNNKYFKQESKNISNRILEYITKNKKTAFPLIYYNWNIINPVTKKKVDRGYDAFSQAYGYEKLYKLFNNNDSSLFSKTGEKFSAKLVNGCTKLLLNPIIKAGEGHMVLTLAAISKQWNRKTVRILEKKCFKEYKNNANYDYLVLLYAVLYNDSLKNDYKDYFKRLLDSAPEKGPYNYNGDNEFANFEWSTSRRYSRPENRGSNRQSHPGDYNGLDYMIIYNLYKLYYH